MHPVRSAGTAAHYITIPPSRIMILLHSEVMFAVEFNFAFVILGTRERLWISFSPKSLKMA
jgi:hypothetical protein